MFIQCSCYNVTSRLLSPKLETWVSQIVLHYCSLVTTLENKLQKTNENTFPRKEINKTKQIKNKKNCSNLIAYYHGIQAVTVN